jgi:small subunit ribosomal protein S9
MPIKKKSEKKEAKAEKKEETLEKKEAFSGKYFYALGKRKCAIVQVRIYPEDKAGESDLIVNKKKMKEYFPGLAVQNSFLAPLKTTGMLNKFKISVLAKGGGQTGQAEAAMLGIARALVKFDEGLRKPLRDAGLLTRDSRIVERKKPGLKKARRAPQWQKR